MVSRPLQLLLSLLALLLGLGGAFLVYRGAAADRDLVDRPVLLSPGFPGDRIEPGRVVVRPFPAAAVAGTVARPEELYGRVLRAPVPAGVPLLPEALGDPVGELPPGSGEVVFELSRAAALDGRLAPGDRVRVLALRRGAEEPLLLGEAVVLEAKARAEAQAGDRVLVRLQVPADRLRPFADAAVGALAQGWVVYLYREVPAASSSG